MKFVVREIASSSVAQWLAVCEILSDKVNATGIFTRIPIVVYWIMTPCSMGCAKRFRVTPVRFMPLKLR